MILAVGHEKGGTGKTTAATNLAVWLQRQGRDVLLVDADRQQSASHWAGTREGDERVPAIRTVQLSGNLASTVRDLARRYQDIILDCGGRDSQELRSALLVADTLLAPIRPSQLDLWATSHLVELVEAARVLNPELRAMAVLSMVPTNARVREADDATEMLAETLFGVAAVRLCDRKAYRDAICGGWGVVEMDDRKAGNEISALGEEIYGQVQKRAAAAV